MRSFAESTGRRRSEYGTVNVTFVCIYLVVNVMLEITHACLMSSLIAERDCKWEIRLCVFFIFLFLRSILDFYTRENRGL